MLSKWEQWGLLSNWSGWWWQRQVAMGNDFVNSVNNLPHVLFTTTRSRTDMNTFESGPCCSFWFLLEFLRTLLHTPIIVLAVALVPFLSKRIWIGWDEICCGYGVATPLKIVCWFTLFLSREIRSCFLKQLKTWEISSSTYHQPNNQNSCPKDSATR